MKCVCGADHKAIKASKTTRTTKADYRVVRCSNCGDEWETQEVEVEGSRRKAELVPPAPPKKNQTKDVIAWFCETWKARKHSTYLVAPRDAGQVSQMLKTMPQVDELVMRRAFDAYLRDNDPFLFKQGHGLGFFCSQGMLNRYGTNNAPPARANGVGHYPAGGAGYGPIGERKV